MLEISKSCYKLCAGFPDSCLRIQICIEGSNQKGERDRERERKRRERGGREGSGGEEVRENKGGRERKGDKEGEGGGGRERELERQTG